MKPLRLLGAMLALTFAAASAHAEWPDKPIRLVVPYGAGSMGDLVTRVLGEELRQRLKQQVIVENKTGAGGNIGTIAVMNAAPDGYTFLVGATNNYVVNQFLYSSLKPDPMEALVPVSLLVVVPSVFFTNTKVPAKDFKSFVAWAKAHKGTVNYGSPGSGTTTHLSMFAIDKALGLGMAHVPYAGGAQAVQALLGNEVQAFLVGAALGAPQVRAGRLTALAVSAPARLDVLPDTPTFQEVGLGQVKASNWWGLAAPRGTPEAIVTRLAAAVVDAMASPSMKSHARDWGVTPIAQGPQAMAARMQEEVKIWERAVSESGAKAD